MNDWNISKLLALVALIIAALSFVIDGPLLVIAVIILAAAVIIA